MSAAPASPRLPSPPPPTEIQLGPPSPSFHPSSLQHDNAIEQDILDANFSRRIHPGAKSDDMPAGPPLVPLSELDSAFQLQEHLKALHYHHTRDGDNSTPITRDIASIISRAPEGVDSNLWLYELCRFLINKCNDLIIGFFADNPPCSVLTCPEMRASEWQFLCAVHETPKSCCAIDYCCHTLDWAAALVTSQKHFPSRLSLSGGTASDETVGNLKQLVNIFRRLQRIFAHAWFQHLAVFWEVEGQTGLYVLFKTVCDSYDLLPHEAYKLPPPAEGLEAVVEPPSKIPTILKSEAEPISKATSETHDDPAFYRGMDRSNTRRHIRSSPSTGFAVTTVLEAEEEEIDVSEKLGAINLNKEKALEAKVPKKILSKEDTVVDSATKEDPEAEHSVKVAKHDVGGGDVNAPTSTETGSSSSEDQTKENGEPDDKSRGAVSEDNDGKAEHEGKAKPDSVVET